MGHPCAVLPALRWLVVVLCLLVASGCDALDLSGSEDEPDDATPVFATTFTRIAPQGYIDLSLEVSNPTDRPVTLTGRLVARDAAGDELPGVTVSSAYGIERGQLLLMPGGDVDLVQLDGEGADQVADVTLEDVRQRPEDAAAAEEPIEVTGLGKDGRELTYDGAAIAARVDNPNSVAVRVRVVLLVLAAPKTGVPQQAVEVRDVTTIELAPGASKVVPLDAETTRVLRRRALTDFVSLRPVFAP